MQNWNSVGCECSADAVGTYTVDAAKTAKIQTVDAAETAEVQTVDAVKTVDLGTVETWLWGKSFCLLLRSVPSRQSKEKLLNCEYTVYFSLKNQ